ncbi:kelch repeat-containing protein [Clostridioides difficile]|nr:kelch repeat-containing protein [Clostridioides difficile]
MTIKLEENSSIKEVMDSFENIKNDLQSAKNNLASTLGSPFISTDSFSTTKTKIQTFKNTLATNLTKKGVSTYSSETVQNMVNKVDNIELGNTDIPNWYKPKNIIFDGASSSLQQYPPCIAVENYVYFLCNNSLGLSLLRYDTLTNINSVLAKPSVCDDALMVYYDGYIYRIGGYNNGSANSTCQKYNISTNTWSYISNMITPRGGMCGNAYLNEIHTLYGYTNTNANTLSSAISEYYKTNTNTWTTKTDLPASRYRRLFVCAKTDTYNFCITGTTDPSSYWDTCISNYYPFSGTLTRLEGIHLGFATSINNMLYTVYYGDTYIYVGGYNHNGAVFSKQYDKKGSTFPYNSLLKAVSVKNKFIYYCDNSRYKCFIPEL